MAFRTLEFSNEAEIHIKDGQLEVTNQGLFLFSELKVLKLLLPIYLK